MNIYLQTWVLANIFHIIEQFSVKAENEVEVFVYIHYSNRCAILRTDKEFTELFDIFKTKLAEFENCEIDNIKIHFIIKHKKRVILKVQLPFN